MLRHRVAGDTMEVATRAVSSGMEVARHPLPIWRILRVGIAVNSVLANQARKIKHAFQFIFL
jgi:hypothetical protein